MTTYYLLRTDIKLQAENGHQYIHKLVYNNSTASWTEFFETADRVKDNTTQSKRINGALVECAKSHERAISLGAWKTIETRLELQ